ncbi:alpha/beta hydrolase [Kitasatospora sp. NPDC094015]|uniref:alpha/beta fold hydrolase n=1 Tax=Kitasatospora sp. NPDC094015 TaxID=3155205 RepID=UPI00333057B1
MSEIDVNGVSLYHEAHGEGPGVILVHGSWSDADGWARVVPGLAGRCRVVAYDRRGHSRSEDPPGQGSVHQDVADLAALIEELGLAPAFVCGNSFGALIALRLAVARPDLVRGLAVHEPPALGLLRDDPELAALSRQFVERNEPVRVLLEAGESAAAAELFVDTVAFGPDSWPRVPAPLRHTFIRNAPSYLDELRDPEAFDLDLAALARYRDPVLLTRSDNSPPLFEPVLDRIALTLPQAESHLYRGAGHVPHVTEPAEYVALVLPRALAGTV